MTPSIILFDGVCNLCNASVQFIIKRDTAHVFRFAALQSHTGQSLLEQLKRDTTTFDTIILIENEQIYTKSTAALRIARQFGGIWRVADALLYIPTIIRDAVYGLIARNRYTLFGKQDTCWIPTPELKALFLP